MKLILCLSALALSSSSFAQRPAAKQLPPSPPSRESSQPRNWTGKLVDAEKKNCNPVLLGGGETCPVSVMTTAFGLIFPDGKYVKFDAGGDTKAIDALKRSRKGSTTAFSYWRTGKSGPEVRTVVTGSLTADTLNVETIRIE